MGPVLLANHFVERKGSRQDAGNKLLACLVGIGGRGHRRHGPAKNDVFFRTEATNMLKKKEGNTDRTQYEPI